MSNPNINPAKAKIKLDNHGQPIEKKQSDQVIQSEKIVGYVNIPQSILDKNTVVNAKSTEIDTARSAKDKSLVNYHLHVKEEGRFVSQFDDERSTMVEEIEVWCSYDPEIYEALGYQWYWEGPGSGITNLKQVTGVTSKGIESGSFKVMFNQMDGDPVYEYYFSTAIDPLVIAEYRYFGNSTACSKLFKNQPSGTMIWVIVRATKDGFENGAWSKPVNVAIP